MGHWKLQLLLLVLLAGGGVAVAADENNYTATIDLFQRSKVVQPFFENSYGYAVFPMVGKGGMAVGGSFGKGQVYRAGQITGTAYLTKLSIGFQLGGQAFSEVIFFKDQRAYEEFTRGTFEFDASASAVAITAGVQATAGSSGSSAGVSDGAATGKQLGGAYYKGMAVFTHIKGGLMYEAAVGGQVFSFEPFAD